MAGGVKSYSTPQFMPCSSLNSFEKQEETCPIESMFPSFAAGLLFPQHLSCPGRSLKGLGDWSRRGGGGGGGSPCPSPTRCPARALLSGQQRSSVFYRQRLGHLAGLRRLATAGSFLARRRSGPEGTLGAGGRGAGGGNGTATRGWRARGPASASEER